MGEAVEKAEGRLAGIDSSVRPLEDAAGRIEEAVRDNGKEVGSAVSGSGVMVRKALEDVRDANGSVRDVLDRAGDRVEDSVNTLAASQRSFTTGIEVAADVSAQILTRLGEVVEESARGVTESHEVAGRLAEQAGALREVAERFGGLVDAMRAAPLPSQRQTQASVALEKVPQDATPPWSGTR